MLWAVLLRIFFLSCCLLPFTCRPIRMHAICTDITKRMERHTDGHHEWNAADGVGSISPGYKNLLPWVLVNGSDVVAIVIRCIRVRSGYMGTKHAISTSPATIKFLMQRARGHLKSRYVGACRRVAGVSVVFVMVLLRFFPNKKLLVDKHYFSEIAYSTWCPGCIRGKPLGVCKDLGVWAQRDRVVILVKPLRVYVIWSKQSQRNCSPPLCTRRLSSTLQRVSSAQQRTAVCKESSSAVFDCLRLTTRLKTASKHSLC